MELTTAYRTLCSITFLQKSRCTMYAFRPHSNPARGVYFSFPIKTDPRFIELKRESARQVAALLCTPGTMTFREVRYLIRFEASYQRAVARGFVGDRRAWVNSYPSPADLRWR